ncbi:MAG: ketopantoate reductase family protein, partial [Vicinamibacterales bacterium]
MSVPIRWRPTSRRRQSIPPGCEPCKPPRNVKPSSYSSTPGVGGWPGSASTIAGVNIVVLGAGAIGSAYGYQLSRHHDVTLVGTAAHMQAISDGGLRIEGS